MKKRVKILVSALAACALVVCIGGCASNVKTTGGDTQQATSTDTVSFTDSAGRQVDIPKDVERVAGSGPIAQQILLTFAPEKMVGLSNSLSDDQAKYLGQQYADLPVYGQMYGASLNKEALASANPQLIIDIGEQKKGNVDDLNQLQDELGVPVIYIASDLESMSSTYQMLGQVLGNTDRANQISDYCTQKYSMIKDGMSKIPDDQRIKLLYCLGDSGTNVIGKGSYHAEVLEMIGDNVAVIDGVSSKGTGNQVSLEQINNWNPQMIIFGPDSVYGSVKTTDGWNTLSAVQNDNYYEVPDDPYNWMGMPPSINSYMGMQWLARLCYPSTFTYDMYQTTAEYYKLFYQYDLTQADYDQLTANCQVKNLANAA
ncbi:MAG: ABC transporter substrate-binding protein [Eggerthellaceae bacterium]|nr:ABC transporter substrate-binding protein [Eggerthellaceae bacterium]MCH4221506.1 ABC transporter substrate-binding protein [Eggerthellaceae bacterium]